MSDCSTMTPKRQENCRVLIVEDNTDAANVLALALQRQSHDVQTTRNGTEALTVAASYRPHVVLIDIGLPGLDGLYVARQLRSANSDLLLIAATGRSTQEDVERSREAGCDHHLVKPLDFGVVSELLNDWKAQGGCDDA